MNMQVNPAECNGAGKKKKENGKDPSHYRIHLMIPEDENEKSKKSKGRKGMAAGEAESIDILNKGIKGPMPVKNCF